MASGILPWCCWIYIERSPPMQYSKTMYIFPGSLQYTTLLFQWNTKQTILSKLYFCFVFIGFCCIHTLQNFSMHHFFKTKTSKRQSHTWDGWISFTILYDLWVYWAPAQLYVKGKHDPNTKMKLHLIYETVSHKTPFFSKHMNGHK